MISRGLDEIEVVSGFDSKLFHSCTVSGYSCTCGPHSTGGSFAYSYAGRMIDRLGLRANFNAVKPFVVAHAQVNSSAESTGMTRYYAVSIGLEHSASTCSGGFSELSTELWSAEQALQVVTTATTTSNGYYTEEGRVVSDAVAGALTTAASSSTSTAYGALATTSIKAFDLTGAGRYLRIVVAPRIETTGCGSGFMDVQGGFIFGYPDETPQSSQRGRIFVTSGCSS